MTSVTHIYRVVVDAMPAGSDKPGWRPEGWEMYCETQDWCEIGGDPPPFWWPRQRNFFCPKAARRHADTWNRWGAEAHVEVGDVAWSS